MSDLPLDLLYTKDHEWIRLCSDDTATIGITAFAQESLGDITFVEYPEEGDILDVGEVLGIVESVKAASDIYMPLKGEIVEANEQVAASPELINQDPYGEGWLLKIRVNDKSGIDNLLKPDAYTELIGSD